MGKPRFLQIQPGDTLRIREDNWDHGTLISSRRDSLRVQVEQVLYFETFQEMLESIGFGVVVPTARSLAEAIGKYREFYSQEDEKEYGVVALLIEVVN